MKHMRWLMMGGLLLAAWLAEVPIAWGDYGGTGIFAKITNRAEVTEGYYVVASSNNLLAMTHTNSGAYFTNAVIAPASGILDDPSPAIVWRIQTNAAYGGLTIYNEASNRYVAYAGIANSAYSVAAVNGATGVWSFAWREPMGCFAVSNVAVPYRYLQYNATAPRFSCYSNGTQQHLTLYKMFSSMAPWFTDGTGSYGATTGVAMAFAVAAAGVPPPGLTLQGTTASGGYVFAPETGMLDYLPPWADGGVTQSFVFVASNDLGLAMQTVVVAVVLGEPPPALTNVGSVATNQIRLAWPAAPGRLYRVATTPDLVEPAWSNATPDGLMFTNQEGACVLPLAGVRGFYRIAVNGDYIIVDLSEGPDATNYPVRYANAPPPGGWGDEYKATKLVLRRMPAGTFTMGSPTNELGRSTNEVLHSVTLTKDFYIGVFEITQKQWERVMGTWPSFFSNATYRESRPVEQVSYNDIRGMVAGTNWPADGNVDAGSFMGRLRTKTGQAFDLPTEAQWEHACRAGTTNALNSGKDLTSTSNCPNMDMVGRYWYNGGSGYNGTRTGTTAVATAKAGSYQPSPWGLYDVHGNVWEWCLDWYEVTPAGVLDPRDLRRAHTA